MRSGQVLFLNLTLIYLSSKTAKTISLIFLPHLEEETETWDKRGAQESMGVNLVVTRCIGDIEPEEATSCIQAGTLVEQ